MFLTLPLSVVIPRKTKADKNFILNLNVYRNTHHMTLNQAKVAYKEKVKFAVETCRNPVLGEGPYKFLYTVYPGSKRAFDLGNVLPIIQKFTDDALIELGIITDDNYKIVREIDYRIATEDKENPRVELLISSCSYKYSQVN